MAKVCFRILLEKLFCLLEASTYQFKNASYYLPEVCILLKNLFFFLMANDRQTQERKQKSMQPNEYPPIRETAWFWKNEKWKLAENNIVNAKGSPESGAGCGTTSRLIHRSYSMIDSTPHPRNCLTQIITSTLWVSKGQELLLIFLNFFLKNF